MTVTRTLTIVLTLCGLFPFFMGQELLNPVYAFMYLVLLLYSFFVNEKKLPRPSRKIVNIFVMLLLAPVFLRIRFDYIVEAFMEGILVVIAAKMLEEKKWRDYAEILLLFLVQLSAYAMLSVQKLFAVYCVGTVVLSCYALMLASCLDQGRSDSFSKEFLLQLGKETLKILGIALPVSLLIFFIVPRSQTPISRMSTPPSEGGTVGFSDHVRLGDVASIQKSNKLVFRAQMPQLSRGIPYWRGAVMEVFTGDAWNAAKRRPGGTRFDSAYAMETFRQEIYMEPGYQRYFLALDVPSTLEGVVYEAEGDGVFINPNPFVSKRLRYVAVSSLFPLMSPQRGLFQRERLLELPPDFSTRLQEELRRLTAGLSDAEKVQAIKKFLSPPGFTYSLEGLPVVPNPLEVFIFETKRGNCEYFASAMGVMLRMAGIPSRLVSGYLGGTYSEAGGYYIVTQGNAHVWVEVWDDARKGWTRHDPTPQGLITSDESGFTQWGIYMDLLDYQWARLFVNYDLGSQEALVQALKKLARDTRDHFSIQQTAASIRRFFNRYGLTLGAVLICGVTAGFIWFMRKGGIEKRLMRGYRRAMKRHGYTMRPGEGLEEFAASVRSDALRDLAKQFAVTFESIYYRDRIFDPQTRRELRECIRAIRRFKQS